jgi:predicted TIM-barrel fold metal-dependent hydrolase
MLKTDQVMDSSGFVDIPILDAHVHFSDVCLMAGMLDLAERVGADQLSPVSTPHPQLVNLNPQALHSKVQHPDRVYVFASLDYTGLLVPADPGLTLSLAEQVDRLLSLGCDGIQMVEGKPSVRRMMGLAFDGEAYADFFARVAELDVPILWHVGDPEENWDEKLVSPGAKQWSWFYGDGTFPAKEDLYAEVRHVLDRPPDLKVIFAHFYFLSAQLPRASALLERYPNVNLDITPGTEMYPNFTADFDAARELFMNHQDRIVFGTDSGALEALQGDTCVNLEHSLGKFWMMRSFLETEETFSNSQYGDPRQTFLAHSQGNHAAKRWIVQILM